MQHLEFNDKHKNDHHFLFLISELNLSHNHLSKLPDELADLNNLAKLNISYNSFIVLPPVVFKIPKLRELDASHNAIIGKWNK